MEQRPVRLPNLPTRMTRDPSCAAEIHRNPRAEKQKAHRVRVGFLELIGRRPTLPHTRACSTIGAERLNFRVRDGNGWDPLARITQSRLTSRYLTGARCNLTIA